MLDRLGPSWKISQVILKKDLWNVIHCLTLAPWPTSPKNSLRSIRQIFKLLSLTVGATKTIWVVCLGVVLYLRWQEEVGRWSVESPRFVTWTKGRYFWKMSTIVHSRGVGGLNCVKFGPRNYWMTPLLLDRPLLSSRHATWSVQFDLSFQSWVCFNFWPNFLWGWRLGNCLWLT